MREDCKGHLNRTLITLGGEADRASRPSKSDFGCGRLVAVYGEDDRLREVHERAVLQVDDGATFPVEFFEALVYGAQSVLAEA